MDSNDGEYKLSPAYKVFATLYDGLLLGMMVLLYISMYIFEVTAAVFKCLMLCAERSITVIREQREPTEPESENPDAES